MSNTITRRAALTGTAAGAAAIVAGTAPAMAVDHDRAEWLALWRDYVRKEHAHHEAYDRRDEAVFAARKHYPEQRIRYWSLGWGIGPDRPLGWHWWPGSGPCSLYDGHRELTRDVIEDHYRQSFERLQDDPHSVARIAEGEGHRAQSLADLADWEAECSVFDEQCNVPALDAALKAASAACEEAQDAIVYRPATSIAGIAIKLALWVRFDGRATYAHQHPLDDAESTEGIEAYRDAMRLAGFPEHMFEEGEPS